MKKPSKKAIEKFFHKITPGMDFYDGNPNHPLVNPGTLVIERWEKDEIVVNLSMMYNHPQTDRWGGNPKLNDLEWLKKIAEFFGTTNISDERFANSGCETCDYGSSYGSVLTIRPE